MPPPDSIPHDVPQILINREQLPHLNFDVELLGDCDVIVNELCHRLGGDFEQLCDQTLRLSEITEKPPRLPDDDDDAAAAVETVTTLTTSEPDETPQEETARGAAPAPSTPSEETAGGTVAEASVPAADHVPPEPCPAAAEQPLQNAAATTAESPEDETEDTPKEEEAEPRRRSSNLDLRRRCWMSRLGRSPISKRLESKPGIVTGPLGYGRNRIHDHFGQY